jgi:hypothetical protein
LLYPWLIYKKEHLTYLASGKKKSTEDQDKIKEVKDKENLFTQTSSLAFVLEEASRY